MKKGFTLIELLAVIIVLAVIALIATPIVLDVVDSAKLKAFEESTYGIMETVKLKNYDDMLENSDKIYTFPNDELVFQGERPKGGTVISQNGNTAIAIHNGKYCATKKFGDEKVTITENISNCELKQFNLSGNITGKETNRSSEGYDQILPVKGKVQLIKNNQVIYETTSDDAGNYSFNGVVSDDYLLLVSRPNYTKYGEKINLADNTSKNLEVTLYYADINNDNIVGYKEKSNLNKCYAYQIDVHPECSDYDLNNDGYVNGRDISILNGYIGKISEISINAETHNVSGKVTTDRSITYNQLTKIYLYTNSENYSALINSDGTFSFENIPSGSYRAYISNNNNHGAYNKFIVIDDDIKMDIFLYYGAFDANGILSEANITALQSMIEEIKNDVNGDYTYDDYAIYDMNSDGVLDEVDLDILKSNVEKSNQQMKNDYCF